MPLTNPAAVVAKSALIFVRLLVDLIILNSHPSETG
jgi:hypothetical protein